MLVGQAAVVNLDLMYASQNIIISSCTILEHFSPNAWSTHIWSGIDLHCIITIFMINRLNKSKKMCVLMTVVGIWFFKISVFSFCSGQAAVPYLVPPSFSSCCQERCPGTDCIRISLYLHPRRKMISLLDHNAFVRAESGWIFLISNPENPEFPFGGNQVFITKELPRIPLFNHSICIMYNYISGVPFSCHDSSSVDCCHSSWCLRTISSWSIHDHHIPFDFINFSWKICQGKFALRWIPEPWVWCTWFVSSCML